jgi:hypothetical protein
MLNLEELIDPGFLKGEGLMDPPAPTLETILAVGELTDTISGYEDSKRELVQLDRKFDEVDEQATKLEIIQDTVAKFGFTRSTYRLALWNPFVARQTAMFPGVEDISLADRPDSIQATAAMESLAQVVTTVWDFIRQILLQIKHALTKFFHFWSIRVFYYRRRIKKLRAKAKEYTVLDVGPGLEVDTLDVIYANSYLAAIQGKTGSAALNIDELESANATDPDLAQKLFKIPATSTDSMKINQMVSAFIGLIIKHFERIASGQRSDYLPTVKDIEEGDPKNLCVKAKMVATNLSRYIDQSWENRPQRTPLDLTHTNSAMGFARSVAAKTNITAQMCDLAEKMLNTLCVVGNNDFASPIYNRCAKAIDVLLAASRKYQFGDDQSEKTQNLAKKLRETADVYRKLASCITKFADHHLWWVKETLHTAEAALAFYKKPEQS